MIKYSYKCLNKECKKYEQIFNIYQSIKDEKIKTCDDCKKETLERIIEARGGFVLKGVGVYKNGTY